MPVIAMCHSAVRIPRARRSLRKSDAIAYLVMHAAMKSFGDFLINP